MKFDINRPSTKNTSSIGISNVKCIVINRLCFLFCSFFFLIIVVLAFNHVCTAPVFAKVNQGAETEEKTLPIPILKETPEQAPARIEVKPLARDHEIRERLKDILKATGWFTSPEVRVKDGVFFFEGMTETGEFKKWAGDLARNTQDVVAVVNQIELKETSLWDFQPAFDVLREQWRGILRGSPFLLFGLFIFLSLQNPFRNGDLIEIAGITGFVQMLTIRATGLMTPDGNHVQIPNASVYKSSIHNYSSNPNRRGEFTMGIGYNEDILTAQEIVLKILTEHPAVLKDPEPWVLVDNLGTSTVDLKIYFWLDGRQHSLVKVKSSVIRLVKRAFQEAGISMSSEARELIFPNGVQVRRIETEKPQDEHARPIRVPKSLHGVPAISSVFTAEGDLLSEAEEIQRQARQSRTPEEGQNLLKP